MYVIYEKSKLKSSILTLIFKNTGSIFAKDGIAYFLAHMLNTKGTLKHKEKFFSLLEERAINLNVNTNREYSSITIEFLNEKTHYAILKLLELLANPNFSKEAFIKSKKELLAKKEALKNDNNYIALTNLFSVMFKNTPLAREVIGNPENVELNDVIEEFSFFCKDLIFVNGGKKVEIEPFLEILPNKKPRKDKFFKAKPGEIVEKKEVEQSYIHFGSNFDVDNNEFFLAKIATFVLGSGGFGSRIMEEVRVKRGYAYSAYALNEFKKSYKIFRGYLQTKLKNTQNAINLVKEIIYEFTQKGITQNELESAKKFLIGSEVLKNETLHQRLLRKFNEYYLNLKEGYFEKELKLIENITLDEVNEFIKRHQELNSLSFSIVTK